MSCVIPVVIFGNAVLKMLIMSGAILGISVKVTDSYS